MHLPCCSWLIAVAFWLSGGFIKSGLGNRIAYGIVALFGKTTLGLTYSLVFAEALLAPAIPSVAARAGKPSTLSHTCIVPYPALLLLVVKGVLRHACLFWFELAASARFYVCLQTCDAPLMIAC